ALFAVIGCVAWCADASAIDATRSWIEPPPPLRYGEFAVFDPTQDRMLVIGGQRVDSFSSPDVWSFHRATTLWEKLDAGDAPPFYLPTGVLDPKRNRVIVVGSVALSYEYSELQTWELSLDAPMTWRRLNGPGPPDAWGMQAV